MKIMTCIEDLRQAARRRVPRQFFDYAEAGSYAEQTLRANRADLEPIKLRHRILADVSRRSTATTILGEPASLPLMLAPIGLCGMQHGDGEILACRAAQAAGIPFTLSTMSICSIEDVAAAVDKPFWFQLYVMKDRGFIRALIERDATSLSQWTNSQFDASLNWKDVEWIASLWPGKLILKGILDVEDARQAAKTGAAAIVVSNHGGRQLDGAP